MGRGEPRAQRVLLAQMPWASPSTPSIAIGILERLCDEASVTHAARYFNMDVAAGLDPSIAEAFADRRELFGLSEHLFAADLFGAGALASDDYLRASIDAFGEVLPPPLRTLDGMRAVRDVRIPALLDAMVRRVLDWEPTVVGFSATFNQVVASLALAARIKRARPEVLVICGGASFDGEMGVEYHRGLPRVIDHVFLSEAEPAFRELLRRLSAGEPTRELQGTTWWDGREVKVARGKPLADMDSSPMPDYTAYFTERERAAAEYGVRFAVDKLLFESSRGCWWGEKNHCVFCGLNPETLEFRSKSLDRVIDEIVSLSSRHRVTRLMATDWIISRKQRGDIFLRLQQLGLDVDLFFETRADMTKAEMALMKRAGVNRVQPGIESFSTPLLHLMKKHTQGIRQVQFLRWCRELEIDPSYNLLAGFPGEEAAWYHDMAALIPRLHHLDPPRQNVFLVELHRFSPLFNRKQEFGITDYDVRADYRFNFPPGVVDRRKCGYFFEYTSALLGDTDAAIAPLREAVGRWLARHERGRPPLFRYRVGPDFVTIVDTRHGEQRELTVEGLARSVLLLCDEVKSRTALARDLRAKGVDERTLDDTIAALARDDLLLLEGDLVLTLPIATRPRTTAELRALAIGEPSGGLRLVAEAP